MSKNLKSLICCILALLFVSGTVIAVFADSNDLFANEPEAVSATDVETEVTSEVVSETEPAPSYRLGDVNFDGKISAADARLALRFSAQVQQPTADEFIVANVILDDLIKANDARLILRVAAQLSEESDFGVAA